jgi:hypothetical protein
VQLGITEDMGTLRKLKVYFTLDSENMLLLAEAYIFLAWARFFIALPFSKISPSLGIKMKETSQTTNPAHALGLKDVAYAIERMSKHTFWESKCLVRAIAGMRMLERRDIESTLYLGTTVDESGKMIAHAWLRSGNRYVLGKEGMERFTVVGKFAKIMKD